MKMFKKSFLIARLSVLTALLSTVAGVALVSSCQKEKEGPQQPVDLELRGSIDVPKMKAAIDFTKAASTDQARAAAFLDQDKISVYIVPRRESSEPANHPQVALKPVGNYRDNLIYQYDLASAKFVIQSAIPASYPNSKTFIDIYGIFPYLTSDITSTTAQPVSVKTTQHTKTDFLASDFMNAVCLDNEPKTTADLNFHHRLSRAIINITVPALYKGSATLATGAISQIRLLGTKIATTINLTNTSAPLVATGEAKTITAYINPTVASGNIYNAEAILIPQTANLVIEVDLNTVDGKKHVIKYAKTGALFADKTKYEYAFEILPENTLTLANSAISPWGTNQELGSIIGEKKRATESFTYSYTDAQYDATKFVNALCNDGITYKVAATAASKVITFTFTGTNNEAPENYPYTVVSILPLNTASEAIGTAITVNKTVTARQSTAVPLN